MNRRPFRRRLAIRFAKLVRWLHIYLSMFGLAAVLFFSATGITLNHPDWFFGEAQRSVQSRRQRSIPNGCTWRPPQPTRPPDEPADLSRQVDKLEVVECLADRPTASAAPWPISRSTSPSASVTFKGPGYAADAFIDRDSGRYTLTQSFHGVIAILNDLHKGRDTGLAWSILIDASAIVLTFISLTGLVLLFYLKLGRIPGLAVAIIGTIIVLALFLLGVP